MGKERADAIEAVQALAYHLSFFPETRLSVNEVSKSTGFAWGTVQRYASLLSLLRQSAPDVTISTDGIEVGEPSAGIRRALSEPLLKVTLYVFVHARLRGGPRSHVPVEDHLRFFEAHSTEIADLEKSGLAVRRNGSIQLTSAGIGLAADLFSDFLQPLSPAVMMWETATMKLWASTVFHLSADTPSDAGDRNRLQIRAAPFGVAIVSQERIGPGSQFTSIEEPKRVIAATAI